MKDLVLRLEEANEAYRNGSPVMSDAAFDALEDELRAKYPNHPWFDRTGAPAPVGGQWPKVKHSIPMRSLNKAQNAEDLRAWWPEDVCVITEKLDGISCALHFSQGRLTQALTRGDGETGEDITRNVLLMKGFPHKIFEGIPVENMPEVFVRGEIVCRRSDFDEHFPNESNPRNTASGTAKRQSDPEKCRHLTVLAYQYLEGGVAQVTKLEELLALQELGFTVSYFRSAKTFNRALEIYQEYVDTKRDSIDWEIDGLVVEVNDRDRREGMGERNHRPAGACAFKFPHEQKPTVLRNIVWQVGQSGRITPVAEFDPVQLAGAEVKRASLHNLDRMHELLRDVGQEVFAAGDKILCSRRNDVIPFVEAVLEGTEDEKALVFSRPEVCPECSSPLHMDGAYLVCPNTLVCPAQISGAVKRWVAKLGIKFLGETLIDTLCGQGYVEGIADLYRLDPAEVSTLEMTGRKVGASAERGWASLRANMDLPLHVFVGSLGIPLIGRSMAKTIVDGGFDTLMKMLDASVADLASLDKMGETKAQSFVDGLKRLSDRCVLQDLRDVGVTIQTPATGDLKGISVCMSGFRDKDMVKAIEAQGGTTKSSVGKTLGFLVLKDPSSTSSKAKKAHQYGVAVIGIEDMWTKLGGR